jgi:hypothetical protein
MFCCELLQELAERDFIRHAPLHSLANGRILTEIDTDYFLVFGAERPSYVGINYCPFCGRALSRELWNKEKKRG